MIVDTNVYLSRWPFRRTPCDELRALVDCLRRSQVHQAWAGSLDGLFHRDVAGVNERLTAECREAAGLLVPFGTVNPVLPDWEEDLRRCAEDYAMRGIRLHPAYHGYAIGDPRLRRLLEMARDRGLVVQLSVRMDDPRVQHHRMQVADLDVAALPAVLAELPGLRLMLTGALRSLVGPALGPLTRAGVHVEISMLEGLGCVGKLLETVPLERVHFGSHLPLFVLESAVLKLQESALSPEQLSAITRHNAERLLAGP